MITSLAVRLTRSADMNLNGTSVDGYLLHYVSRSDIPTPSHSSRCADDSSLQARSCSSPRLLHARRNLSQAFRILRVVLQECLLGLRRVFICQSALEHPFGPPSCVNLRDPRKRRKLTGQSIDQLSLRPGQLPTLLKPLDRLVNLALLQRELREGGHGDIAVRVHFQRFPTQRLGLSDILLPLEDGKRLIDEGKDIAGLPAIRSATCAPL